MDLIAQIKQIVAPLDVAGSPGGVVAVARHGVVEVAVPFGEANLEHSVANTRETVFYIASTSKQFVAAAAAVLEADGVLSAEDSIARWVPELAHLDGIQVQHLIHHTSGIRDKYALAGLGRLPEETISTEAGTLRLLARQRSLNFEPGSRFMYSNSGYALLATIIERASGRSLIELTDERLFAPLGMTETRFRSDTSEVIPHRASGYAPRAGGWSDAEYTFSALGPGGVISTVDSLARWALVYQDGALDRLADRLLTTVVLTDGSPSPYGYGVMLDERNGQQLIHHSGGVPGFSAEMLQLGELTVICLSNTSASNAPAIARRVLDLLDPAPAAATMTPAESSDGEGAIGRYLDADECSIAEIALVDGLPVLVVGPARVPLQRTESGWTSPAAPGIHLEITATGMTIVNAIETTRFSRIGPAAELTADIAGSYTSDELGVTITLAETPEGWELRWPAGETAALSPLAADLGLAAVDFHGISLAMPVRIVREGGVVTALRISLQRALGNVFTRV